MKLIDILVEEWKGEWPSVQGFDFVAQDGSTVGQTVTFFETPPHAHNEHKRMWVYCDGQIEYSVETMAMSSPAALAEDHTTAVITREQYMEHFNARSKKFQKMMFKPKDATESLMIQNQLFEMGYQWAGGSKTLQDCGGSWIFTDEDGNITWAERELPRYEGYRYYVIKKVEFVHSSNSIEINGKVYRKSDVEKLLSNINPIN